MIMNFHLMQNILLLLEHADLISNRSFVSFKDDF